MEPRNCFTFFASFYTAISGLPEEQQLEMYKAITEYALFGAEPQLDGLKTALFALMRPNIDSSNKKRSAGKKGGEVGAGGAPFGNKNAAKNNSKAFVSKQSKSIAKQKQNNTDIEIEIEKEKEIEKERDIEKEKKEEKEKEESEEEKAFHPDFLNRETDDFLSRHASDNSLSQFSADELSMICGKMAEAKRARTKAYF